MNSITDSIDSSNQSSLKWKDSSTHSTQSIGHEGEVYVDEVNACCRGMGIDEFR
jgi:hypothetical protein